MICRQAANSLIFLIELDDKLLLAEVRLLADFGEVAFEEDVLSPSLLELQCSSSVLLQPSLSPPPPLLLSFLPLSPLFLNRKPMLFFTTSIALLSSTCQYISSFKKYLVYLI